MLLQVLTPFRGGDGHKIVQDIKKRWMSVFSRALKKRWMSVSGSDTKLFKTSKKDGCLCSFSCCCGAVNFRRLFHAQAVALAP